MKAGTTMGSLERARHAAIRRALLGLFLVAIFWPANWMLAGMRTHLLFFPLWLGYVLTLDGWTELRTGDSLWARSRRGFVALFVLSIPFWWMFEFLNRRLQNWEYLGGESLSDLEYAVLSSISFSTVIPAVLVSAELVRGTSWIERFSHGPRLAPSRKLLIGLFVAGLCSLAALLVWPRALYPFVWMFGVFMLEPLCRLTGGRSLLDDLERGDWRPWVSLWTGVLLCGFFWELWNFKSYPKWIYHVPGVDDWPKLFEMPLPGYLGYLPFSLELYLWKELFLREPRLLQNPPL